MSTPIDQQKNPKPGKSAGIDPESGTKAGYGPDLDLWGEANELADKKRGRGRPRGALNKHTQDFEKWYYAQGFTDPLEKMAAFMSAQPEGLLAWLLDQTGSKPQPLAAATISMLWQIIREQHACAKELAPYLHGKKPIQIAVSDERLPQLAILMGTDQITLTRKLADTGVLSLGEPLSAPDIESNEINALGDQD